MAAIAYQVAECPLGTRVRLVSLPVGRTARRPSAAVYRRRRAVAGLLVVVALLAVLALRGALAGPGGGPLTATGTAGVGSIQPAAVHIHVVQPGETLWSIVQSSGQPGDPRPRVDRLAAQTGGRPLQVGQRLVLP